MEVSSTTKTTLIFVKGGETQHSIDKRWQGQKNDQDLTKNGYKFAKDMKRILKDTVTDACYTSPLLRASCVADKVTKIHQTTPIKNNDLNQRDIGRLEGWKEEEVTELYQKTTRDFEKRNPDQIFEVKWIEGIETNSELIARTNNFISMILKHHQGKTVLAFTHTDNIRAIIRMIDNQPITHDYKVDRDAVLILEAEDGKFTIKSRNGILDR